MDQQQHDPADDPAPVGRPHVHPGPVEPPADPDEPRSEHGDLDALIAAFHQASRDNDHDEIKRLYRRILVHPERGVLRRPAGYAD